MNRFDTKIKDVKPKELLFVILYGGIVPVLMGIVLGYVDYILSTHIGISLFMVLFFLVTVTCGGMIHKNISYPHIVYIVLTVILFIIAGLVMYSFPAVYGMAVYFENNSILLDIGNYLDYIIISLIRGFGFNTLFVVLALSVGTYVGIKRSY